MLILPYFCRTIRYMDTLSQLREQAPSGVLSLSMLQKLWPHKSLNACKAWLKRACQQKQLLRLHAGLYVFAPSQVHKLGQPYAYHPFQLANMMRTPSYVSLESALSHYNLIPERVETTTSVVCGRHFECLTPAGCFSFTHLKLNYFNFGFYQSHEAGFCFLIATPLKALIDYIVVMKKPYCGVHDVVDDLRLDWDALVEHKQFVNLSHINFMLARYKSKRMQRMLHQIKKHLNRGL